MVLNPHYCAETKFLNCSRFFDLFSHEFVFMCYSIQLFVSERLPLVLHSFDVYTVRELRTYGYNMKLYELKD